MLWFEDQGIRQILPVAAGAAMLGNVLSQVGVHEMV